MRSGNDENAGRRRDEIAAAAVDVLADKGLRGLTHRAVDAAAGLGQGAVNYHAPNRSALLHLALGHIFAQYFEVAASTFGDLVRLESSTVDVVVTKIADFVERATSGPAADRVIARHIMLGEAQHDSEIRGLFDLQRAAFVAFAEGLVEAIEPGGPPATAEMLVVMIEGLLQRQVLVGTPLPRPVVETMVRALLPDER